MKRTILTVLALMMFVPMTALASGASVHPKDANISLDQETLRKGLDVFTNVCMGCHSAKYITYQGLMDYPEIGLSREAVDELRGEKSLMSGLISDLDPADAIEAYGKVPPDLSLVVPGRRGGADYVYSLLTGYEHDEHGKIEEGRYNVYFPGNSIAMPDPLAWLDHDKSETADIEADARNVASFLAFIGDPHQEFRRWLGGYVVGFLLLLTIVLYLLKREIWKDVH